MNRITIALLVTSCLFASPVIGQESGGTGADSPGPKAVGQTVKRTAPNRESGRGVFEGVVVRLDVPSATMSVKARGVVVNFDLTNPTLSGYKNLSEIRPGNRVVLSYGEDGVTVKRLGLKETTLPEKATQVTKPSKIVKKLQRRPPNGGGGAFDDADVNKDGKITPVELSVAIRDITMERFRKYDRDCNGCLDSAEFAEAVKQEMANGNQGDR